VSHQSLKAPPRSLCSFENHIDETIAKHPKEAELGGVPGIRNKVRAYTAVILRSKDAQETFKPENVNGIPLWAQLYYLLRCGYPDEAMHLLGEHDNALRDNDRAFPGALKTALFSSDRRLPRVARDQLSNDFNSHIRNNASVDQYKYAMYKLAGRFDLSRKTLKVASTTEDWMWVQLSLVREGGANEGSQEQYDLADLGRLVIKYGADKFDEGGKRPFAWFNLLLYTGQFERVSTALCDTACR
jgi:nuclear pore complex protein Nup93